MDLVQPRQADSSRGNCGGATATATATATANANATATAPSSSSSSLMLSSSSSQSASAPSRYESQKKRDWNTFGQYLKNHRPPLSLGRCSGAHVLEFLRYLDQFGKTKVHALACPFFGHPSPPAPCPCPLRQAWGSLDALVGRLRAAFDEHGGRPEANPFASRAVRLFLRDIRDHQARARGITYHKKKKNNNRSKPPVPATATAQLPQQQQHHHHHHHHQSQPLPPPPPLPLPLQLPPPPPQPPPPC